MSRVARTLQDPADPKALSEYLSRMQRVVDGGIEFGNPNDPKDPQSTTLADGASHNGTLVNVTGAWVEKLITATGRSNITCTHNLGVQTAATGRANVRWLIFGWFHDGTGVNAATELNVNVFYVGGTTTTNAIDLVVSANLTAGALTVNGSHPIGVTLFFTPAVR